MMVLLLLPLLLLPLLLLLHVLLLEQLLLPPLHVLLLELQLFLHLVRGALELCLLPLPLRLCLLCQSATQPPSSGRHRVTERLSPVRVVKGRSGSRPHDRSATHT